MMNQVSVKYFDMPSSIKAYTVYNKDDTYTVVLNSRLCHEQLIRSYSHEIKHIRNGDYCKNDVDVIEIFAHSNN